jgi:hypothetical protein
VAHHVVARRALNSTLNAGLHVRALHAIAYAARLSRTAAVHARIARAYRARFAAVDGGGIARIGGINVQALIDR